MTPSQPAGTSSAEPLTGNGICFEPFAEGKGKPAAADLDSIQTQWIESQTGSPNLLIADDLLRRCNILLAELKQFTDLCELMKHHTDSRRKIDCNHFRRDVEKEIAVLKKTKESDMTPQRVQQLLTSSNLTFLEAVWDAAKHSSAITGITGITGVLRHNIANIYAEGGLKWIKVSKMTEKGLLMDMAKQGWDWQGMSDEESDEDVDLHASAVLKPENALEDDQDDVLLVKMAKGLIRASRLKRFKYRHPKVHIVLPRIHSGQKDIDLLLHRVRTLGATVQTGEQILPLPPFETILHDLVFDEFNSFTPTLNIDCTLLIGIVSDISHRQVQLEAWFSKHIRDQIQAEEKGPLMTNILWPVMTGHGLVCTSLAAQRMRAIVDLIGTNSEKARTRILMGDDTSRSSSELLEDFQLYSRHPVPKSWQLPIRVYDADLQRLPPLALAVAEHLRVLNRSVFLSGWAAGNTTITSNMTEAKAIEMAVEENRRHDTDVGPDIWVCHIARSLVARKGSRDKAADG